MVTQPPLGALLSSPIREAAKATSNPLPGGKEDLHLLKEHSAVPWRSLGLCVCLSVSVCVYHRGCLLLLFLSLLATRGILPTEDESRNYLDSSFVTWRCGSVIGRFLKCAPQRCPPLISGACRHDYHSLVVLICCKVDPKGGGGSRGDQTTHVSFFQNKEFSPAATAANVKRDSKHTKV